MVAITTRSFLLRVSPLYQFCYTALDSSEYHDSPYEFFTPHHQVKKVTTPLALYVLIVVVVSIFPIGSLLKHLAFLAM